MCTHAHTHARTHARMHARTHIVNIHTHWGVIKYHPPRHSGSAHLLHLCAYRIGLESDDVTLESDDVTLESDDVTLVLKLGLSTKQDSRAVQLPGPDTIK